MQASEPQATFVGREWAYRRVERWLASQVPCLVITGRPGAGKSAFTRWLAATAAGELTAPKGCRRIVVHAAHSCKQQNFGSIDPITVIERIAQQLTVSVPGYAEAVVQAGLPEGSLSLQQTVYRAEPGSSITLIHKLTLEERNPRRAWDRLIRGPVEQLQHQGQLVSDVVIVIDGLDEAVEGFKGFDLARLLSEESHAPVPHLRLLITTRPGQAVDRLRDLAEHRFDLTTDQPAGVDDIARYVQLLVRDRSLTAWEIARNSQGSFLYAVHLVAEYLATGHVAKDSLPVGLAAFYRAFLNRHIGADMTAWREAYRPVLGVIAEAQAAGLTRQQIIDAVGGRLMLVGNLTVDDVIYDCYPHLHGDLPEGPLRVGHRSFRDYLRGPGEHHIYPAQANDAIVTALLAQVTEGGAADWSTADAYTRQHLLTHALAAGRSDDFLGDLGFLLHADAASLHVTLQQTTSATARRAADLCGINRRTLPRNPDARRVALHFNAVARNRAGEAHDLLADIPEGTLSHKLRWVAETDNGAYDDSPRGTGWVSLRGRPHAVASGDMTLLLYDLETGSVAASHLHFDGTSRHIAVQPPDLIAVADRHVGGKLFTAELNFEADFAACFGQSTGLSFGVTEGRVFLVSAGNASPDCHEDPYNVASFRAHLIDGSTDQKVQLVDFHELDRIPSAVTTACVNGQLIAAYSLGDQVHLITVPTAAPYSTPIDFGAAPSSLSAIDSPCGGAYLAVASNRGATVVYALPEVRRDYETAARYDTSLVHLIPSDEHGYVLFNADTTAALRVFVPPDPLPRQEFFFDSEVLGMAQGPSNELIVTTYHHVVVFCLSTWSAVITHGPRQH